MSFKNVALLYFGLYTQFLIALLRVESPAGTVTNVLRDNRQTNTYLKSSLDITCVEG